LERKELMQCPQPMQTKNTTDNRVCFFFLWIPCPEVETASSYLIYNQLIGQTSFLFFFQIPLLIWN
jgi:hypothetical protein